MANKTDVENLNRVIKERDDTIATLKLDAKEFNQSWKSLSESFLKAEAKLKEKDEAVKDFLKCYPCKGAQENGISYCADCICYQTLMKDATKPETPKENNCSTDKEKEGIDFIILRGREICIACKLTACGDYCPHWKYSSCNPVNILHKSKPSPDKKVK